MHILPVAGAWEALALPGTAGSQLGHPFGMGPLGQPQAGGAETGAKEEKLGFSVLSHLPQSMLHDRSSHVSPFQGDQQPGPSGWSPPTYSSASLLQHIGAGDILEPAGMATSQGGVSSQVGPAEQEQAGPSRIARRRKKPQVEAESSSSPTTPHKRQKLESPIGKGRPKKHVSGLESAGRRQAERAPSPPEDAPKPEPAVELTEDRLSRAVRGVPLAWTPPPLDYPNVDSPSGAAPSIEPSGSPVPSTSQGLSSVGLGWPEVQSPPGPSGGPHALPSSTLGETLSASAPSSPQGMPIPLPGPGAPMPPNAHPFYRLPVLQPWALRKEFRMPTGSMRSGIYLRPIIALRRIQHLFLQPYLSPAEAEELISLNERILQHLALSERSPVWNDPVTHAVVVLGRRYMLLEAVLCSVQLLEHFFKPQEWWSHFVTTIPTEYQCDPSRYESPRLRQHASLAARLSAALGSIKSGTRPSAEMTVTLKRELFCENSSPSELREKRWDPWRNDDKAHGSSSSS